VPTATWRRPNSDPSRRRLAKTWGQSGGVPGWDPGRLRRFDRCRICSLHRRAAASMETSQEREGQFDFMFGSQLGRRVSSGIQTGGSGIAVIIPRKWLDRNLPRVCSGKKAGPSARQPSRRLGRLAALALIGVSLAVTRSASERATPHSLALRATVAENKDGSPAGPGCARS